MDSQTTVVVSDGPVAADGTTIQIAELVSRRLTLRMLSLGATMWQLFPTGLSPERSLCLFHEHPSDYAENRPYLGSFVGPVSNRIGGSNFEIDGTQYEVEPNEGRHHLHGGPNGFSRAHWDVTEIEGSGVRFELRRADGQDGYPGNLTVVNEWHLDGATLRNEWTATSDRATPVSPTNHSYWNLADRGDVLSHRVEIPASRVVAVDSELIPTGVLAPVGSLDARTAVGIGDLVAKHQPGVDQSYVLDRPGPIRLIGPDGVALTITTTLPAVQLYTGQYLEPGDTGGRYGPYAGVCLETQYLPDAINQAEFASPIAEANKPLVHSTTWEFAL